jgi:acyl carrier protein
METDKLFYEIREIIAEIIEVDEDEIQGDTRFREDLEVDSMKALEILVAVEKKYKIKIPEERLKEIRSLNDSVALAKEFITAR